MEVIKIIGVGFITMIVTIILKENKKEYALYSVLIGGSIIITYSIEKINVIVDFVKNISNNLKYNNIFITLILKITGIAILTEYAVSICKDTGENAIANKIDFGSKIIIISMSIPIISSTLEVLTNLLL